MVLPVPVPPMKIALRLASRKVPVASSRTCPSSTGVSAKTNLSRSLRTGGELGSDDAIADRAGLPVGAFSPQQTGDERIDLIAPGKTLTGNLIKAGAHAVKLQLAHGFQNLMALHQAIFLMLS
jgi:hypothetical protein